MKPPFPSFTSEWHNDTYDAISPTSPSLSVQGKTIVITGGGAGIGRETAKAYAEAGAAQVAILGRTQKTLSESKSIIEAQSPATKVTTHIVDVADEETVGKTATEIGGWDVLILNAGVGSAPTTIEKSNLGHWWRAYEVRISRHGFDITASTSARTPFFIASSHFRYSTTDSPPPNRPT